MITATVAWRGISRTRMNFRSIDVAASGSIARLAAFPFIRAAAISTLNTGVAIGMVPMHRGGCYRQVTRTVTFKIVLSLISYDFGFLKDAKSSNFSIALAFSLCAALSGCTVGLQRQDLIDNPTPLAREIFDAVSPSQFESGTFTSSRGTMVPYRLLRPSKQSAGNIYPLVVQLHGSGGIGTDNLGQLDRMAKSWAMPDVRDRYQAFILIPQFPIRSANYGPASPDQHAVPSPVLNDALEFVSKFSAVNPVDKSRIYATGFSMGGSAAWLLPSIAPGVFAGIVPISGVAPPDSQAANFSSIPVLAIHGGADMENSIAADRRFIQTIAKHDPHDVSLVEYKGLEHQPPADIHPGFWWRDWLFSQRLR